MMDFLSSLGDGINFIDRKKVIMAVIGLVVLVGSGVVVGLTVQRIQNQSPTVTRPRAETQCSQPPPACCSGIQQSYEFSKCTWDGAATGGSRGWCTKSQCGGAALARSAANGGNQNCGLFRQTYCQSGGWCANNDDCYNGETCQGGTCKSGGSTGGQTAFYTAVSPIGGVTSDSLTPTFQWNANTTGINYNNIYVSQNSSCNYDASTGQWIDGAPLGTGSHSITFPKALSPNTTYYWNIYGDGPAGIHGAGCQNFRTPSAAAATHLACVNSACAQVVGAGADQNGCTQVGQACGNHLACVSGACALIVGAGTDQNGCTAVGQQCGNYLACVNGACAQVVGTGTNQNGCTAVGQQCNTHLACVNGACAQVTGSGSDQNGCTAVNQSCSTNTTCTSDSTCPTGKVCFQGSCVDSSTIHYGCSSATCMRLSGGGANLNGCSQSGGTCCASNSDCTNGQSCDTTQSPNVCGAAAVHFICQNKTCTSVNGAGSNANGCTTAGTACCNSDVDCTSGQTCNLSASPSACVAMSQVQVCWGNGGVSGSCYDCNGDGVVNILDFSCFAKVWQKPVQ